MMEVKLYKVTWAMPGMCEVGIDTFNSLELAKSFLLEDCEYGFIEYKGEIVYERVKSGTKAEQMQ